MKTIYTALAAFMAIGLSTAFAAQMPKESFDAAKLRAETDFKTAKQHCDDLSGNAKDICMAEARGKFDVAKANAEAEFKGTDKARYEAAKTKVDADYKIAKERCDDLAGNDKAVCLKEAKAEKIKGEQNAKLSMKKHETTSMRSEEMGKAHEEAREAESKATYETEVEKCNMYSGDAKDRCISNIKSPDQG